MARKVTKVGDKTVVFYDPRRSPKNKTGHTPRAFPYWKVQYFEDTTLSWKDVQKAHYDKHAAELAARRLHKKRVRLMQVESEKKRCPLPEIEG